LSEETGSTATASATKQINNLGGARNFISTTRSAAIRFQIP
jgi:hypothetical protein